MKLKKDWIKNVIFLWIILVSIYRLFGEINSVVWSVFWFCTEFLIVLALTLRLIQKETEKRVKPYCYILVGFYGFSFVYETLKMSSKTFSEYMECCTDSFYSFTGVVLIFIIFAYSLFEKNE